jgi:hypothetical protein
VNGLDVEDIYTAVAVGVEDKGDGVRETKNSAGAASNSEGNRYFRKGDKRGFRMTRPQLDLAQPQSVDEAAIRSSRKNDAPSSGEKDICLEREEARQEEIRGITRADQIRFEIEVKWLLAIGFVVAPRCRVITLQRTRSPLVFRQDCVLKWAKLCRVPRPRTKAELREYLTDVRYDG